MLGTTLVGVLSVYGAAGACDQNRGRLLEMVAPHVASALHAAKAVSGARVGAAARTDESTAQARESHLTLIH
jgi:hypothetical protein